MNASLEEAWSFVSTLQHVASCIPGYESVALGEEGTILLRIKLKAGCILRTFEIRAKLEGVQTPSHLAFSGEGLGVEIQGVLDIAPGVHGNELSFKYNLTITPVSVMGKLQP